MEPVLSQYACHALLEPGRQHLVFAPTVQLVRGHHHLVPRLAVSVYHARQEHILQFLGQIQSVFVYLVLVDHGQVSEVLVKRVLLVHGQVPWELLLILLV